MLIMGAVPCQIRPWPVVSWQNTASIDPRHPGGTKPHSEPKCSGVRSRAEPTFSADSIKILVHKVVDDSTGRNLHVKAQAPENTSFFSGTGKDPCESSAIGEPSAAPSSSAAASVPQMIYLLRCQDQNRTTELSVSIGYGGFDYSFVVPLR